MGSPSVKKAADLLRQGAVMLGESCPVCGLPLFKLKNGEVVCPDHGRVFIVRDEDEASAVKRRASLEEIQDRSLEMALKYSRRIEEDPDAVNTVIRLLEVVERTMRIMQQQGERKQS